MHSEAGTFTKPGSQPTAPPILKSGFGSSAIRRQFMLESPPRVLPDSDDKLFRMISQPDR
jgi:hypothetical protein